MNAINLEGVQRIHFVGIGGAGMSGIAEVLLQQGYRVSGSDINAGATLEHLQSLGAVVSLGHAAEHIAGAEAVVVSSMISPDNPEILAARAEGIPVLHRAQMLAFLMHHKCGIAIAGTHGKTTTTSLVTSILTEAGFDPTFVIGGVLKSAGVNAHAGQSRYFVAEADESDASFLHLHPKVAIVTNIDADHLGTYGGDFNRLCDTFIEFLDRLPMDGLAVVCMDDPIIRQLLPRITRPLITYGFDAAADVRIVRFRPEGFRTCFTLHHAADGHELEVTLNLPGAHNALNTAAACVVARHLGVKDHAIQSALLQFAGVARRMQIYGELEIGQGRVLLIDDYGHHPREIRATWSAIRQAWPNRRLVVVYQPHRYSRTQDLFEDFVKVLSEETDKLILLDVYPAGEEPISGADGAALFSAVQKRKGAQAIFVPKLDCLTEVLQQILCEGDILLTQGAGSIGTVAPQLVLQGLMAARVVE